MNPQPPSGFSFMQLAFWRLAAIATDLGLRHRERVRSAIPYLTLLGGGLLAYAIGRVVGVLAFGALP